MNKINKLRAQPGDNILYVVVARPAGPGPQVGAQYTRLQGIFRIDLGQEDKWSPVIGPVFDLGQLADHSFILL
jgi:hypothetical protein